jgi:hypothetical protein
MLLFYNSQAYIGTLFRTFCEPFSVGRYTCFQLAHLRCLAPGHDVYERTAGASITEEGLGIPRSINAVLLLLSPDSNNGPRIL